MTHKDKIVLLMMIKNEEARITVSFDSVKDLTDTFIILDTGSTDNTIPIIKEYCEKNKKKLYLKEEAFVNFEVSRNVSLDYADEVLKEEKYLLLLDCNDELKNIDKLIEFLNIYKGESTGFHLKQSWWNGKSNDSYWNMRLIKSHKGWRYKGVVHEYIANKNYEQKDLERYIMKISGVILYQDRTKDDDKSYKRFSRDKELLFNEYLKNPNESRTMFYLAQTCSCLQHFQESYKYYMLRLKLGGFQEEIYHSYYRLGEISRVLKHPWEESYQWYMKAFGHSQRVEPLLKIIEYYKSNNYKGESNPDYLTAYMYCSIACKLLYPKNQILFIDKRAYDYTRWHYMGIVGYYVGRYKEGKEACIKALEVEDNDIDMTNLLYYLRKERELKEIISNIQNKTKLNNEMKIKIDHQNIFPSMIAISINENEMQPEQEDINIKRTKYEIITKATVKMLEEIKNKQ